MIESAHHAGRHTVSCRNIFSSFAARPGQDQPPESLLRRAVGNPDSSQVASFLVGRAGIEPATWRSSVARPAPNRNTENIRHIRTLPAVAGFARCVIHWGAVMESGGQVLLSQ